MSGKKRGCDIPGCPRKHFGKGLCNMHYNRKRNGNTNMKVGPIAPVNNPGQYKRTDWHRGKTSIMITKNLDKEGSL